MTGVGEQPCCHTNATTSGRQNQVLFSGCVFASETSQLIYLTSMMAPYPCAEECKGRGLFALAVSPYPRVVKREGRGLVPSVLFCAFFGYCAIFLVFFVVLYLGRGCFPVILSSICFFFFSCCVVLPGFIV